MTDAQIREIRERCEAATPGPWVYPGGAIVRAPENPGTRAVHSDAVCDAFVSNRGNAEASANVAFIAHARTDVPTLLDELDRMREAAKGAAVIADSAGQTIRELRAQNEQLFGDLTRSRTHADLTAKLVYDAVKTREKAKDRLRKQIANTVRARRQRDGMTAENAKLRAELEAAKRDIKEILKESACETRHKFCRRAYEPLGCDSDNCEDAEWRGPVADNTPAPEMGAPGDEPTPAHSVNLNHEEVPGERLQK